MIKGLAFVAELIRICLLLGLALYVFGSAERVVYQLVLGSPIYYWTMPLGNLILLFVLYRNYFQFKGWYRSEQNQKLERGSTRGLLAVSLGLILVPFWINV